ncbi:glutamate-5-semialdehyde dehydrogenase [Richelia intracellularis]|jgi:glutamate-5-semialdehyde dehydrogenase|nr:glutamate-5-semialdehyde dehydrogenase [Richelia intracellularis]
MTIDVDNASTLIETARKTKLAALKLAILPTEVKNQAIEEVASALESAKTDILEANIADCQSAEADGMSRQLYKRLRLDEYKLRDAITGIRDLHNLADPVGVVQIHREIDAGLIMKRITCPLGVLGVIFEARPEAAIQIAPLAIKSGNGVILKSGKEAKHSCEVIVKVIKQGLSNTIVSPDIVQLVKTREETLKLLKMDRFLDLIIPRGSKSFVRFVQENTNIPVLGHADGICHLYIDKAADMEKSVAITVDAKAQYPAACNAIETLLIHSSIAYGFLPPIAAALQSLNIELRGDKTTRDILPNIAVATDYDWETEYSDLILAIKIVDSLEDAITHINHYGSKHTDTIITEDSKAAEIFLAMVDSAGVYHNCSTRFADGFRYGFGAEVGISTQKTLPRGPVGLEGLVTYKYTMVGNAHIALNYTGDNAKSFTHRDL